MSSDEEVTVIRKKKFVVDSSDENEENNLIRPDVNILKKDSEEDEHIVKQPVSNRKKKKTKCLKTFESDSDSDGEMPFPTTNSKPTVTEFDGFEVNRSSQCPIESDSSSVSKYTGTSNVEKSEEIPKNTWYKNTDLFEGDSTDEEYKEHNLDKKSSWYKNNEDLFAGESSNEDDPKQDTKSSDDEGPKVKSKNKRSPQFQRKERASKKKAQNEIHEIHKESQRMLRETQVSIPYHRPRQHTLAEFLGRKKATPTISLRNSADQLASAWRAIEEREKEAESFYKSESEEDSSEGEGPSYKPKEKAEDKDNEETGGLSTEVSSENTSGGVEKTTFQIEKERSVKNDASNCADLDNCIDDSVKKSLTSSDIDVINNRSNNEKQQLFTNHLSCKTDDSLCDEIKNSIVENKNNVDNSEENFNDNLNYEHKLDQKSIFPKNQNLIDNKMDTLQLEKPETKFDNGNVVNTEEFSLRMSESPSDLETCEAVSKSDLNPASTKDDFKMYSKIGLTKPINSEDEVGFIANISYENQEKENNKNNLNGELCSHGHEINENKHANFEDIKGSSLNQNLNDHNEDDNMENILKKKYNLKPGQSTYGPKINGSLDEVIEFEEVEDKPGFDGFMKRFYTHLSYKKKPLKKKTPLELSIVSAETDSSGQVNSISEEVVKVLVGDEEEEQDPSLAKPGAKLSRLRAHLRAEMERKREQEWAKKKQEQRLYEDEIYEGEKDVCDGLDEYEEKEEDEKEDQPSEEEESESEEDEDEVGDAREEGKERKKSGFIDDEAEESDADNCEEREENDSSDSFIKRPKQKRIILQRQDTDDMFVSQEVLKSSNNEEEEFPSFQKPLPLEEKAYETEESETSVCQSPAFRLTALEGKENHSFNWSEPSTPCKDFISPKTVTPVRARLAPLVDKSPQVGSQYLENLCSGQFVSQPLQDNEENNTQDFQLFLVEDSQMSQDQSTPVKVTKITQYDSDGKDQIRSLMVDDHDDNDVLTLNGVNKNKKVTKLNFSDDEEEENTQPLENNLGESDGGSDESDIEETGEVTAADEVAYASEENEVVKAAGDFLDVEAELSESEWDSADEDERGLDALETEEADREDIDQRKLKRELEQMHMKQVMKDDNRDVKLLQEMFCEDGDLQSDRQRQRLFRWSNNGTFGDDGNRALIDSDEEKAEDDEDEENWRKSRHEREQFLKELQNKKKKNPVEIEIEIEESDSQLLKLGQKAIKRMSQEPKLTPPLNSQASPITKQPFNKCTKRGSFLSRAPQMLSRLAQMTAASDGPVNGPKNSRNFLFTSISPTKDKVEVVSVQQSNKRKMPVIPLPVAKRPCVQKPKMANKKSLFDTLFKVPS